ncbi:NUDIX hydrolase [Pokkaliibacter sp. CJK22405]|uniref:NUDIX hydrolase n=1 Tax=Pokkaliibacter sp. CJK22405 TaxID=3384615 RepID=UPI0039848456
MTDRTPDTQQSEADYLAQYNIHDYDLPLTSVDLAIFTLLHGELQVLLVERDSFPARGQWALPGGFVDIQQDLSLEATAIRKLQEKTGVATPYVEQVLTTGSPERDPRGWSITVLYMALIAHAPTQSHVQGIRDARWIPWAEAQQLPLAFDHSALLMAARERLQSKTAYTALPLHVLNAPFTLSELQRAFETLLDAPLEKKSFRRRMEEAGLLEAVDADPQRSGKGRPAALFKPKTAAGDFVFSRILGQTREG